MASDGIEVDFPDDFENWETLEELEHLEDQLDEVEDMPHMDVDDGNENITDTEHLDQEANQKFISIFANAEKRRETLVWQAHTQPNAKESRNKGKRMKNTEVKAQTYWGRQKTSAGKEGED